MKILSKQNFNQNESKNFVVDNLSSAPSNPILGQVYYNTQDERAYVCIKSGETPEWADLSLQEEVSIGGEEPNGRDIKIWINPEDMASSSDYGSLPIGSIIPYSGETAPEGYSICDGKELNRETYKELFSIIGTTFGSGDNSTTFNLPNLAGRISVGLDSSDTDFDIIGKIGGGNYEERVKISSASYGAFEGTSIPYNGQMLISTVKNTETGAQTLKSNGIDFKQPYIVLNYIIKIYGEAMLTGDVIDSLEGDSSYNAPSIHAVNDKIKEFEAYSSTAINEGSYVTLNPNPNPNYNPINIQIDGKSVQNGTPTPDTPIEIESVRGINSLLKNTNVNSGDGNYWSAYSTFDESTRTLTRSTTATTESFITHMINNLKSNTTYTLFLEAKSNGYVKSMDLHCYNKSVQGYKYETRLNLSTEFNKYSFTFTTDKDVDYSEETTIRIDNNGSTISGTEAILTVKNVTLVEGIYNSYAPYGHWLAVTNTGKNLLPNNVTVQTINGITVTINNDKSITVDGTSTATTILNILGNETLTLSAGRYKLSGCPEGGGNSTYKIDIPVGGYPTDTGNTIGFLLSETTQYSSVRLVIYNGVTLDNLKFKPMIEKGTEPTEYEPYQNTSSLVNMNKYDSEGNITDYYELSSIGNIKDELNIDKDGNVFIMQNIGEAVLNGSESWDTSGASVGSGLKSYRLVGFVNTYNGKNESEAMLDHFIYGNWGNATIQNSYIISDNLYIRINQNLAPDLTSLKSWLSTNNVTVQYELAESQTINLGKITPLKLLEGTNNITTNDELQPNMKIEYYTDVMGNPGVIPDYDGLPVGSEIDFDGTEIPDGFVQVDDPSIYSSEEVVIGTWFGKKLYRKTLYKSPLIHGTQETINHGIQNVDKIWQDISMSFAIWPIGFQANIPFLNNATYDSSIFLYEINSTSFKLKSSLDRSNLSGYITLLYTKTTD